jgi:hypothetical protein
MIPDDFNPADPIAEPIGDSSGADPGLGDAGLLPELRISSDEPEPTEPDLTPAPLASEWDEEDDREPEPSAPELSQPELSEPELSEPAQPASTSVELEPATFEQPESEEAESEEAESEEVESEELESEDPEFDHPPELGATGPDLEALEARRDALLQEIAETQDNLGLMIREALQELRDRKRALKLSIEQLEKKQERLKAEMRQSFAGASQDVAVRLQSFKDYLVGSLIDLTTAAEGLNLGNQIEVISAKADAPTQVSPAKTGPAKTGPAKTGPDSRDPKAASKRDGRDPVTAPKFSEQEFAAQQRQIETLLDLYRSKPDYYGPAWQLRRTFEPIQADRVADWFFQQGGRGAIPALNSRLQNILVASAIISVLNEFYGERLCVLILANSPERLGDWRRGLQDCLGLTREDFGPSQGVVLFEAPEPMAQRADRLLRAGDLPLIILDEAEEFISLALLQFPLWLAFAPDPRAPKAPYNTDPRTPKASYY